MLSKVQKQITTCNFSIYFISLLSSITHPTQIRNYLTQDHLKLCLTDGDLENLWKVVDKRTNLTTYTDILQVYV